MRIINIPILVTVRAKTEREYKKNIALLPYVYDYLNQQQALKYTTVISNSDKMLEHACYLGFKNTYCVHGVDEDIYHGFEIKSAYKYFTDNKIQCEWFIILPTNQPFKGKNLLVNSIYTINDNYDFITSYSIIKDRYAYFIDDTNSFIDKNEIINDERLHTPTVKMLDDAIYCIKYDFLEKCIASDSPHFCFWRGKFLTIKNNAMFLPINNVEHIEQLFIAENIFLRVKKHNEIINSKKVNNKNQ